MLRAASLLAVLTALGCSDSGDCRDGGCDGDCTSTGECVAAGTAFDLRITWTVDGARPAPSAPGPCETIADLQVDIEDRSLGEVVEFTPVPCDIGQISFFDLPPRFDRVRVLSFDLGGRIIGDVDAPIPAGPDVEVDVELFE